LRERDRVVMALVGHRLTLKARELCPEAGDPEEV
jgi:hypothetical protein